MTVQVDQTGIPTNLRINLKEYGMLWMESETPMIYRVLFSTMATYLKTVQTKSIEKQAFVIKDMKGQFKIAAIMTYHKPTDGDEDKGNWSLEFTLNEEDLDNIETIHDNFNDAFFMVANKEVYNANNGRFKSSKHCTDLFCELIDVLVNYLDDNAKQDDVLEVEVPGVFVASVGVEKGKKVMGIVPGEIIRQIVKSDDIL